MIYDIVIDLWSSRNFASMKDIKKKSDLMEDFLEFIFNKKILSGVVALGYNQICCQTLSNIYIPKHITILRNHKDWRCNSKSPCSNHGI